MSLKAFLSTSELSEALGCSESSLRRWTNSGAIKTTKTPGGHRRIALAEAVRFVRETHAAVVRPELLGLELAPPPSAAAARLPEERLYEALVAGDGAAARGEVSRLYLDGTSAAGICDGPLRSAMQRLGTLWQHEGEKGILIEHRATDICLHALTQLRQLMPPAAGDASVAVGGAPAGDIYLLPSLSVSLALAEAGLRDMNFGPQTPVALLGRAAEEHGAKVAWLSVSTIEDRATLAGEVESLAARLAVRGVPLVVGGRHATELLAADHLPENVSLFQSLRDLQSFVSTLS